MYGSCGDGYALDTNELEFLLRDAFHFEAKRDGFANALGDFIE